MKFLKSLAVVAVTVLFASTAFAQTVINITGATAFRASANNAIIALLGGPGVAEYAYTGAQGIGGTNRAVFKGSITGIGAVIIRASWSGSTAGIAAVANGTPVELLVTGTATAVGGVEETSPVFEFAPAAFSFSDVAQAASTTLSPVLSGSTVGVVPFQFVASVDAPADMTAMTDQIMNALYSNAFVPLHMFTGDFDNDKIAVYAVGRNAGSGSRATVLAETGYGVFRNLQQFQGTWTGTPPARVVNELQFVGNAGYSSNSFIRDLLQGSTQSVGGDIGPTQECLLVSYLTGSDAVIATSNGAKGLLYNGVEFTTENILNGPYTLWGYQWFYDAPTLTATEAIFRDLFVAAIPPTLTNPLSAIPIPDMNVIRAGGDGGPVFP